MTIWWPLILFVIVAIAFVVICLRYGNNPALLVLVVLMIVALGLETGNAIRAKLPLATFLMVAIALGLILVFLGILNDSSEHHAPKGSH